MKKFLKYFIFLFMMFYSINNVSATTIKETTNDKDNNTTIERNTTIIGITKFTADEVITGGKTTKAGADDAIHYVEKNNGVDGYETPIIYIYYGPVAGWYSLDNNNQTSFITDESLLTYLNNELEIYYVNNKEKEIDITLTRNDINIDKLPAGVRYENGKLYVKATLSNFKLNTNDGKTIAFEKDVETLTFKENINACFTVSNGYITNYDNTCSSNVVIPSNINGQNIIGIGNNAFNNKGIKTIIIPDSIMYLGDNAFANNNLTSVSILEKYDSSSFTEYGINVFGTFNDVKYENKLTRLLDIFDDEITINVAENTQYNEIDYLIDYAIVKTLHNNNIVAPLVYRLYQIDEELYCSYSYSNIEEDLSLNIVANIIKGVDTNSPEWGPSARKTIKINLNEVAPNSEINKVIEEIEKLELANLNKIKQSGYKSLTNISKNDVRDVFNDYNVSYYEIQGPAMGALGRYKISDKVELQEDFSIYLALEKDNVVYIREIKQYFEFYYIPTISIDGYDSVDLYIEEILDRFEEDLSITDYEIEMNGENKYESYVDYDTDTGVYYTVYHIKMIENISNNVWNINFK